MSEASVGAAVVIVAVVVVAGAVLVVTLGAGMIVVVKGPSPSIPSPSFGVSRFLRRWRERRRLCGWGADVGLVASCGLCGGRPNLGEFRDDDG